jgi:threonine synthase
MKYYSTNHGTPEVALSEALLTGQAADKGLFMPETFPALTKEDLLGLVGAPYPEIAFEVLRRFTQGVFDDGVLKALCEDAYTYDVPLEQVKGKGRKYVMRLDQGPTASFKDFAARMMARWMSVLMEQEHGELVILTATSGDTGSAVAHAYHGVDRVHVVVLFPIDEVSDRQRKQMTTLGGNVEVIGIEGKFDDGQALVKRAFADPDLKDIRLTSANSINIGRLLPQAVYYVYAYTRLADVAAGERVVFSVPSGNFGDMLGGVIAMRMGLPVEKFIISTNENDEVPKFVRTGEYEPIAPSRVCISNAMNVGHPSNLARLIDVYGGHMDEVGGLTKKPDMDRAAGADLVGVDRRLPDSGNDQDGVGSAPVAARAARGGGLGGSAAVPRRARCAGRCAVHLIGDRAPREVPRGDRGDHGRGSGFAAEPGGHRGQAGGLPGVQSGLRHVPRPPAQAVRALMIRRAGRVSVRHAGIVRFERGVERAVLVVRAHVLGMRIGVGRGR